MIFEISHLHAMSNNMKYLAWAITISPIKHEREFHPSEPKVAHISDTIYNVQNRKMSCYKDRSIDGIPRSIECKYFLIRKGHL